MNGITGISEYEKISLKEKFKLLSQIRNKFAHMSSVSDYTTCYEKIKGCRNLFDKLVPKNNEDSFRHR